MPLACGGAGVWGPQKHLVFRDSKDWREGIILAEADMTTRVQPTTEAMHRVMGMGASKYTYNGLNCSDTEHFSLGYHKNTEANPQDRKHKEAGVKGA